MTTGEALNALLDKEHALLIAGRFDALQALVEDKERLAQSLAMDEETPATLQEIAQKAERNRSLLAAASKGFQVALSRLRDIQQNAGDTTYSGTGERKALNAPRGSIHKKL